MDAVGIQLQPGRFSLALFARLPRPKVLPSLVAHVAQKAQLESKLSYLRWPAQEVEIKSDVNLM
jgi:hypothetical protein